MSISVHITNLLIASILISLIASIVGSIVMTSNYVTNNNLLQTIKWTIVKDYNFRENPSARQNLINDVIFDLNDYNNGNVKYVNKPELLSIKNGKLNMEVGNILS